MYFRFSSPLVRFFLFNSVMNKRENRELKNGMIEREGEKRIAVSNCKFYYNINS